MRKKLCSAAVCCLVLFLTACGLASQASVAALVERDVQALEALAGEIALAGAAGDAEYPGVDRISYDSRTGQVQFECGVSGFASQTSYNGFYYSPGDVPLGFGGTGDMTLAPSGAGWCWEETEGDNWYYTERLRSGWYYYEMHFRRPRGGRTLDAGALFAYNFLWHFIE